MKRVKHSKRTPYSATIGVEKVLDAVDWCREHNSKGSFDVLWGISEESEDGQNTGNITGTFYFSKKEDYTLFCLKWI